MKKLKLPTEELGTMPNNPPHNFPTALVIFGVTGDLMSRKVTPALFDLYEHKKMPPMMRIIGFARREWSDEVFRDHLRQIIMARRHLSETTQSLEKFVGLFSYQPGNFDQESDYKKLGESLGHIDGEWRVCANKLFYLAVNPEHYKTIFNFLGKSKLTDPCSPEEGWTRVIVEKPFGSDAATAEELDQTLGKLFQEIQIYRLDHYLGKEMMQNILSFRFSNNLFESTWNKRHIEKIDIRFWEDLGVEDRAGFYDGVGALRDVGQNHLLQMLALVLLDQPRAMNAEAIREARAKIMNVLPYFSPRQVKETTVRGQYRGYRLISGINAHSTTETYFKIRTTLQGDRWGGVKLMLEAGKRMGERLKEIAITFSHPQPCLCPPGNEHARNKIVISLEPTEEIRITWWSKKPGYDWELEERNINFHLRESKEEGMYAEAYAKLLLDCIKGDQTLFVSTAEIKTMWNFIDPIITAWDQDLVPLIEYEPNSSTISKFEPSSPAISEMKTLV